MICRSSTGCLDIGDGVQEYLLLQNIRIYFQYGDGDEYQGAWRNGQYHGQVSFLSGNMKALKSKFVLGFVPVDQW